MESQPATNLERDILLSEKRAKVFLFTQQLNGAAWMEATGHGSLKTEGRKESFQKVAERMSSVVCINV